MKTYSINKSITIDALPESIFDALTTSEEIIKFYPLNQVISDWIVGGTVYYKGAVNGEAFIDYGVITKLSRPYAYSYRYWSDNHGTEREADNYLTISYSLSLVDDVTELTVTQENIKSKQMYTVMDTSVWDMLLNKLKIHVETVKA